MMKKFLVVIGILLAAIPSARYLYAACGGGGGGGFTPVLEDEFVGPFASWINVKTSCAAAGDGVTNDAAHIQTCLNNLKTAGAGTLYFPAGTYIINSGLTLTSLQGVQIVGADPATTIIKWGGSSGGIMFQTSAFQLSKMARITWDGNSVAATGIWSDTTSGSSTNMLHEDEFFQNFTDTALLIGNGSGSDDAEVTILRCHFTNNHNGVRTNATNAVDVWAWFSTFSNNAYAINSAVSTTCGAAHAFYNDFLNSSTLDFAAKCNFAGVIGNFSSGSAKFFQDFNPGNNPGPNELKANVVVGATSNTVISGSSEGTLRLFDNKISNTTGTGPLVSMSNNAGPYLISVGNTYSISNEISCTGGSGGSPVCTQLNDTVGTVSGSAYNWPTPANLGRTIIDLSPGANAATIQAAINSSVSNQGNHPVVHFPAGSYSVSTTLTIPANLDVQLIGDGYGSIINFTGTGSVIKCSSPCKMLAQDFAINGNMADGFLIGTEDSSQARVQTRALYTQNSPTAGNCGHLSDGLTNTHFNSYGAQGSGLKWYCVIGTGSSVPSVLAGFGVGWGGLINTTPQISVTNNGNILINQGWWEGNASPAFLNFASNTGTFIWDGGLLAFDSSTTDDVTLNNFSGQLTMTGILVQPNSGYLNVPAATSSTNALFIGNSYDPTATSGVYWNVTSGGNVYAKQGFLYNPSLGYVQTADQGGTPSNAFLLNSFAILRTTLPSANWSLPTGVTDARLQKLEILNTTNAVHVETGI